MMGSEKLLYTAPVILFAAIFGWNSSETSAPTAQNMANVFKGIFPKTLSDGTHIAAPRAEGDTFIITITPTGEIYEEFSDDEFSLLNKNAFCEAAGSSAKRYFKNGGKIRFDIEDEYGEVYEGSVFSSC